MELGGRSASTPLLTYYDAEGGRTELSGATLANWQAKIANLLVDYYDVGPGSRVSLSLPSHWIVPGIVGAVAWLDAELVLTNDPPNDVALAIIGPDDSLSLPDCPNVVACSLSPLALPFLDPVPVGIDDFFAEVRTQADTYERARSARNFPIVDASGERLDLEADQVLNQLIGVDAAARRALVTLTRAAQDQAPIGIATLAATCGLPAIRDTSVVVVSQTPETDVDAIARQERTDTVITISD